MERAESRNAKKTPLCGRDTRNCENLGPISPTPHRGTVKVRAPQSARPPHDKRRADVLYKVHTVPQREHIRARSHGGGLSERRHPTSTYPPPPTPQSARRPVAGHPRQQRVLLRGAPVRRRPGKGPARTARHRCADTRASRLEPRHRPPVRAPCGGGAAQRRRATPTVLRRGAGCRPVARPLPRGLAQRPVRRHSEH
eukprot:gene24357-biopygen11896